MRKLVNTILAFFLTAFIFLGAVLFVAGIMTNGVYIRGVIKATNYKNAVATEIASELEAVAIPAGLPEDYFTERIDKNFIESTIKSSVNEGLKGNRAFVPDSAEIKKTTEDLLINYAKSIGIENPDAESISITADEVLEKYLNMCYSPFFNATKYMHNISLFAFLGFLAAAAVTFLIVKLNGRRSNAVATVASGFMLIVPLIFIVSGVVFNFSVTSPALLAVIRIYLIIPIVLLTGIGTALIIVGEKRISKLYGNKKHYQKITKQK